MGDIEGTDAIMASYSEAYRFRGGMPPEPTCAECDEPFDWNVDDPSSLICSRCMGECNTCGDTGRWTTTDEHADPTVIIDLGPCPDCSADG
jgi:hypothetical protein